MPTETCSKEQLSEFLKQGLNSLNKKNLRDYLLIKKEEYKVILDKKPKSKLYQEGKIEAIYQIMDDLGLFL